MPLIRRISRAKWGEIEELINNSDVSADAITNCLRTYNNNLSVWYGKKLQRNLVWTVFQKQQLVISLLMGRVIPKVTIVEFRPETNSEISKREIIDGKQRITALISFIKNEFSIFVDGVDYFFKDLPKEIKFEILNYRIVGDVYYGYGLVSDPDFISDEMKIEIFERVNFAGTPQDADHILNIKK